MSEMIDLTGRKFGRWTVKELDTERSKKSQNNTRSVWYWICECECGTIKSVAGDSLKKGRTQSCGCLRREAMKKRMVDLTGHKFGRWTVKELDIERSNKESQSKSHRVLYWTCECECGNIKSVSSSTLRNGTSQSCGCLKRELTSKRTVDLTGCKFGRWTVKELDAKRRDSQGPYWICECECGNISSVLGTGLKSGHSQSCGCLQRESIRWFIDRKDLTGQQFGKLTVLNFAYVKGRQKYWNCICECGNQKVVKGSSLTTGETVSCGCKNSENRKEVYKKMEPYLYDGTNIALISSKKIRSNNTSGVRGVSFDNTNKKWIAAIRLRGKTYSKAYKNFDDAVKCRQEMEELLFEPVIAEFNESRMSKEPI